VREALRVAREAKPKCTVLTHFSGRFEKTLPDIWEAQRAIIAESGSDEEELVVLLAQDFMTLRIDGDQSQVAAVMRPLQQLFATESSEAKE
jgi:ribonuclease BN (tRNA processing enzyme)